MRKPKSKWEADAIKDAIFAQDKVKDVQAHKTVELIIGLKRYKARFGDNGYLLVEET